MNTKLPQTHRLSLRTGLRTGGFHSDLCYADRNFKNLICAFSFGTAACPSEMEIRACLAKSGEIDWWKDFPSMTKEAACKLSWDETITSKWDYDKRVALVKMNGCYDYLQSIRRL